MPLKKIAACATVFAVLLLWGWYANGQVHSAHYRPADGNNGQPGQVRAYEQHHTTFRPREYVRIVRQTPAF